MDELLVFFISRTSYRGWEAIRKMKIFIDQNSYLEVSVNNEDVKLSIKTKKDDNTSIIISANLNEDRLDKLISELILLRTKIQVNYE